MEVILGILFLSFSNANVKFTGSWDKRIYKSYIVAKFLSTTSWVKFIDTKEFTKAPLNKNSEIFVIYILALEAIERLIHLFYVV